MGITVGIGIGRSGILGFNPNAALDSETIINCVNILLLGNLNYVQILL